MSISIIYEFQRDKGRKGGWEEIGDRKDRRIGER